MSRWAGLAVLLLHIPGVQGSCPTNLVNLLPCSGNGFCNTTKGSWCHCDDGYTGADCSQRVCPSGTAWADYAKGNNVAHHNYTECSGMGYCDYETGICNCRAGFGGSACQRLLCPRGNNGNGDSQECSGQGRCMSMREAGAQLDYKSLWHDDEYGKWDADMIYGCVCDEGFEGMDCSERTCPLGDDPITAVNVSIYGGNGGVCAGTGVTTMITFLELSGNLPALVNTSSLSSTTGTPYLNVYTDGATSPFHRANTSVIGTRERVVCNNRGTCDYSTGVCACYKGFHSSDGSGKAGLKGDCGYYNGSRLQSCPEAIPLWASQEATVCSGKMESCSSDFICNCTQGYTGPACEYMECPKGKAWFDEATGLGGHRNGSVCSNRGICSRSGGTCSCDSTYSVFEGAACHKMACAIDEDGMACGDTRGTCLTMKKLAKRTQVNGQAHPASYDNEWDAAKIQGCHCAQPPSVTNENNNVEVTYSGPHAFTWKPLTGYDCTRAECPRGDDILTKGVTEIQQINCTTNDGAFKLVFRNKATDAIPWNAPAARVKKAIEKLSTIGKVNVIFTNTSFNASACNRRAGIANTVGWTNNTIKIEFLTELGDVPMMRAFSASTAAFSGLGERINTTEYRKGTKENVECNARGICDRTLGRCTCLSGFNTSDHQGNFGQYGDCGFWNPLIEPYLVEAEGE